MEERADQRLPFQQIKIQLTALQYITLLVLPILEQLRKPKQVVLMGTLSYQITKLHNPYLAQTNLHDKQTVSKEQVLICTRRVH